MLLWVVIVVGALAALCAAGALYQAVATALDRRRFPAPGRLVEVGGHRLHLHCMGDGSPTVVIEAAGAGAFTEWGTVQSGVAEFTRVCVYDRGGYGWSDPCLTPRTSDRVVEELRILLANAAVAGPYVLVGHSLGGVNVRHYANRHPEQVAGLVLVDSSHEEQLSLLPAEARTLERQVRALAVAGVLTRLGMLRLAATLGLGRRLGFDKLSPQGRAVALRTSVIDTLHSELSNVEASLAQARAEARPLGNLPVAVLTAGAQYVPERYPKAYPLEQAKQAWLDLQRELAALSSNSRHIIAEHSSHYIHEDEPDLVIDAVRWVIEQARLR